MRGTPGSSPSLWAACDDPHIPIPAWWTLQGRGMVWTRCTAMVAVTHGGVFLPVTQTGAAPTSHHHTQEQAQRGTEGWDWTPWQCTGVFQSQAGPGTGLACSELLLGRGLTRLGCRCGLWYVLSVGIDALAMSMTAVRC